MVYYMARNKVYHKEYHTEGNAAYDEAHSMLYHKIVIGDMIRYLMFFFRCDHMIWHTIRHIKSAYVRYKVRRISINWGI